jgi:quercetin dioxygenase-like cupin family protein
MSKSFGTKAAVFAALIAGVLLSSGSSASAQGFKRTMLQTTVFPGSQYVTALYTVDIDAGASISRHTHPGVETTYVLEGEFDLSIEGQDVKHVKAGDSFQIPAGIVHSAAPPAKPVKLLVTYVVEKDKPLTAIVPSK